MLFVYIRLVCFYIDYSWFGNALSNRYLRITLFDVQLLTLVIVVYFKNVVFNIYFM